MLRTLSLLAGTALCAIGLLSAHAQEPKKAERPVIPGGIEGHVKRVNQEKQPLAIVPPMEKSVRSPSRKTRRCSVRAGGKSAIA